MVSFPGYPSLLGPEQFTLTIDGRTARVRSAEDYELWHTLVIVDRGGKPWDTTAPCSRPHVNEGRWIVQCYWCKKGMLTRPDWAVAFCSECGARYRHIPFPADHDAIARVLCQRPKRETQNWGVPPELPERREQTVDELERENREELQLC